MHADTFFTGGTGHKVCQDYARHGRMPEDNRVYAIVSDGCSSSPDTDVGARILTLSAAQCIEGNLPWRTTPDSLRPRDIALIAMGRVPPPVSLNCLDATLLIAEETFDGVRVWVCGDGVIVAREREDQKWGIIDFDCGGYPTYLTYTVDENRMARFLEERHGKRTIRKLQDGKSHLIREDFPFEDPLRGGAYIFEAPLRSFDFVAILSDGVHSFQQKDTLESVPAFKVIERIMAFKSMTGEFVTRRVKRFLQKECAELGWSHYDDFSIAAICMDKASWRSEEEGEE